MSKNVIAYTPTSMQSILTASLFKLFMQLDNESCVEYNRLKGLSKLKEVKNLWFFGADVKEEHMREIISNNPEIYINWIGFNKQTDPMQFGLSNVKSSFKAETGDNLVEYFARISMIDLLTKCGSSVPFQKSLTCGDTPEFAKDHKNIQQIILDKNATSMVLGAKGYDELSVISAEQAVTCWLNKAKVSEFLDGKCNDFNLLTPTKEDFDFYLSDYRQTMRSVESNHRMEIFQSPLGGKITAAVRVMNCDGNNSRKVRKVICDPHGEAITYSDCGIGREVVITSPRHADWIKKQLKPMDSWWVGEALHLLLPSKHISD